MRTLLREARNQGQRLLLRHSRFEIQSIAGFNFRAH
jgi:hypothetical protein